jgi:serine/threonine protein kinase
LEGGPNWWVKIGDFGIAKIVVNGTALRTMIGTPAFLAPKVLVLMPNGSGTFTFAVDMWVLGQIVAKMLTGNVPSSDFPDLVRYTTGRAAFPAEPFSWINVPSQAIDFVQKLMAASAVVRLTAEQATAHPFVISSNVVNPEFQS